MHGGVTLIYDKDNMLNNQRQHSIKTIIRARGKRSTRNVCHIIQCEEKDTPRIEKRQHTNTDNKQVKAEKPRKKNKESCVTLASLRSGGKAKRI